MENFMQMIIKYLYFHKAGNVTVSLNYFNTWQYCRVECFLHLCKYSSNDVLSHVPVMCWLKNKRPTSCHLLFYFTSYVLNMFWTLI